MGQASNPPTQKITPLPGRFSRAPFGLSPPHVCHHQETGLSPLPRTCSWTWSFLRRLHVQPHRFIRVRPLTAEDLDPIIGVNFHCHTMSTVRVATRVFQERRTESHTRAHAKDSVVTLVSLIISDRKKFGFGIVADKNVDNGPDAELQQLRN